MFFGPIAPYQIFERVVGSHFHANAKWQLFGDRAGEIVLVADRHNYGIGMSFEVQGGYPALLLRANR
jgi:hypothetical protein